MNFVRNPSPFRSRVVLPTCTVSGKVTPARLAAIRLSINARASTPTMSDLAALRIVDSSCLARDRGVRFPTSKHISGGLIIRCVKSPEYVIREQVTTPDNQKFDQA